MGRLTGKKVWITGASAGLGAALAREAADMGASLVLSARNVQKLTSVAQECGNGAEVTILPLDLSKPETFPEVVAQAGPVDILINNGGISQRSFFEDTDIQVIRELMEVNFFGTAALTRLVLPQMLARGNGQLVVTSSIAGKLGTPLRSAYAASKHALQGLFDSIYHEVNSRGIGVTIICPGYIKTDISINAVTGDGSKQGTMDQNQANGMSAEEFARRAWKAILRRKREVYIGGKEVNAAYLKRFAPRLLDRILSRTFRDVSR